MAYKATSRREQNITTKTIDYGQTRQIVSSPGDNGCYKQRQKLWCLLMKAINANLAQNSAKRRVRVAHKIDIPTIVDDAGEAEVK